MNSIASLGDNVTTQQKRPLEKYRQ